MNKNKRLPLKIKQALNAMRSELQQIYADRLKAVVLYGSYARGDYDKDSDIDLLLLLQSDRNAIMEREKCNTAVSKISLKYDTVVSIIPLSYNSYRSKKTPLLLNVRKKGIVI